MPSRVIRTRALGALIVAGFVGLAQPAAGQVHHAGQIGPGSFYEIDVPAVWNGDLVIYVHGMVPADLPVVPPTFQEGFNTVRAVLLGAGYAVAASSFSSNGWAVGDAVQRTHQLSGIFRAKVSQPRRTLLIGASLGALATIKMVEQFPGQYDGVLAMCGPVGGAQAELQYAGDARVTFDYYYPGLLGDDPFAIPPGTQFVSPFEPGGPSPLFVAVSAAFAADPARLLQWATAAKLPFANQDELVASALYVVGFLVRHTNDFSDRVNGKVPYDNTETWYQVVTGNPALDAVLSAQLNAGVERLEADPSALHYYARNYQPTGDLGVPVVTLHTTRDPAIPFAHEALLADAVASAGQSSLLLQREVDRWGHCNFTVPEVQSAFGELVLWVAATQP